jgi:hypothetical protein
MERRRWGRREGRQERTKRETVKILLVSLYMLGAVDIFVSKTWHLL